AETIRDYKANVRIGYLEQNLYYYYLNCKSDEGWIDCKVVPFSVLKQLGPCDARYSLQTIGDRGFPIYNGGWHFSFCGGPERVAQKIQSYAHAEYNRPDIIGIERIKEIANKGWDVFGREGHTYKFVEIDETYPKYVQENKEYFKEIGFIK